MITIETTHKIDAEALSRQLLKSRDIRSRYRLPYTRQQVIDILTAFYRAEVMERGLSCYIDSATADHIDKVATWLREAPTIGLALCGSVGNGKTTLLKALQKMVYYLDSDVLREFEKHCITVVDAKDITEQALKDSMAFRRRYFNLPMLGIDDLGMEPLEVQQYGNISTPIVDILTHRNNEQLTTIVTSNIPPVDMAKRYGERVADRMREMMTFIPFTQHSYRGI